MTTLQEFLTAEQKVEAEKIVHAEPTYDAKFQKAKDLAFQVLPPNVAKFRRQFVTMAILGFQCQTTNCWDPAWYYLRPPSEAHDYDPGEHSIRPGSRTARFVAWDRLKETIPHYWGWCDWHYRKMMFELPVYENRPATNFFLDPNRSRFQYGTQEQVDTLLAIRELVVQDQALPWEPDEHDTPQDLRDRERFRNHLFSTCVWFPHPADHELRNGGDLGYSR